MATFTLEELDEARAKFERLALETWELGYRALASRYQSFADALATTGDILTDRLEITTSVDTEA